MSTTENTVTTIEETVAAADVANVQPSMTKKTSSNKKKSDAKSDKTEKSAKNGKKSDNNKKKVDDETSKTSSSASKKKAATTAEPSGDSADDDGVKRHVMSPLERVDKIIGKLQDSGVTKEVVSQLKRLRKQLDGAKIKQVHASRPPNKYNIWMKEHMAKLKEEQEQTGKEMSPKERFAYCISLWNAEKDNKETVDAEQATAEDVEA